MFHLRYVSRPKDRSEKSYNLLWIKAFKAQGINLSVLSSFACRHAFPRGYVYAGAARNLFRGKLAASAYHLLSTLPPLLSRRHCKNGHAIVLSSLLCCISRFSLV